MTPIQPTPQQVTAAPTPLPQSLVNIVNPSPAPDPTGLGAALSLLGTPNIFRDMSGRQEVADLLKKLSDNSIAIAEAATRAREIQAKYGSASAAVAPTGEGAAGSGVGEAPAGSTRQTEPSPTPSEQLDQVQVWRNASAKGEITPEQKNKFVQTYFQDSVRPHQIGAPIGGGTAIPAAGLKININTTENDFDLGFIRMTKHHLFVEANLHIEPTTNDADKPDGFGLTPSTGRGGVRPAAAAGTEWKIPNSEDALVQPRPINLPVEFLARTLPIPPGRQSIPGSLERRGHADIHGERHLAN